MMRPHSVPCSIATWPPASRPCVEYSAGELRSRADRELAFARPQLLIAALGRPSIERGEMLTQGLLDPAFRIYWDEMDRCRSARAYWALLHVTV